MVQRIILLPKNKSFFLFGPRQTGKTTLIHSQYKNNLWKIDLLLSDIFFSYLKDPSLFRREAIEKITHENVKTIFIDEVQRIPTLLNEVQYLLQNYPCQFILTGSSTRKLKRGGGNLLAGRALERNLFPFTYSELKGNFDLEHVLRFGTLPPIIGMSRSEKIDFLTTYTYTYLREEIQSEGIARNIGGFSRFLDMAAGQFGEQLSFTSIARECHLPVKTVQGYYEILEDTLIGLRLQPWRKSIRRRLTAHPKFYFFDLGVTNAINRRLTGIMDRQLFGRLFEQMIILETHRLIRYKGSEANLYYWRTNHGAEVDLLIEKHGKICGAFEIKATPNIDKSHLSSIRSFRQDNPHVPTYIICTAANSFELEKVKILPWKTYFSHLIDYI